MNTIVSGRVGRCKCGGWQSEWEDDKGRYLKCADCHKKTRLKKFSADLELPKLKVKSKSKLSDN